MRSLRIATPSHSLGYGRLVPVYFAFLLIPSVLVADSVPSNKKCLSVASHSEQICVSKYQDFDRCLTVWAAAYVHCLDSSKLDFNLQEALALGRQTSQFLLEAFDGPLEDLPVAVQYELAERQAVRLGGKQDQKPKRTAKKE